MRKASELLLSLEVPTDHSPGCTALAGTEAWQHSSSPRATAGKGLAEVSPPNGTVMFHFLENAPIGEKGFFSIESLPLPTLTPSLSKSVREPYPGWLSG